MYNVVKEKTKKILNIINLKGR